MLFKTVRLGKISGIPVTAHWSLLLLAGLFIGRAYNKGGLETGLETAVIIFGVCASVLAHEFGHVLAARRYGIGTRTINLNPLGGIAFLQKYPEEPRKRIVVALAGPAVSLVMAAASGAWFAGMNETEGLLASVTAVLFFINSILVVFNLLPIYPMDGGQVFHAIVTKFMGRAKADHVTFWTCAGLASLMFGIGIWRSDLSLVAISLFVFFVTAVELDGPVRAIFRRKRKGSQEDFRSAVYDGDVAYTREPDQDGLSDVTYGIFVAFDGNGRHFAYARHWKDFPYAAARNSQIEVIKEYERSARKKGGELRLLSPDECELPLPEGRGFRVRRLP